MARVGTPPRASRMQSVEMLVALICVRAASHTPSKAKAKATAVPCRHADAEWLCSCQPLLAVAGHAAAGDDGESCVLVWALIGTLPMEINTLPHTPE